MMKDKTHMTGNKQNEAGFALVAMMGVLVVVVILATVMVPNMITSLSTKANEAEKETLQGIGKSSATYLRSTQTWAPNLAAHTGYSPLDSTQLLQNDRLFPRYYALHPNMSGFSNGTGLTETAIADARFLLISDRTTDAAPTITNATEFNTWWTTDESANPDLHIYRGNLADRFLRVSLTAKDDGGSFQIGGTTTNSGGGTLADYSRYHVGGTVVSFDEADTYTTPEVQFALTGNVAYEYDTRCPAGSRWQVAPSQCSCFIAFDAVSSHIGSTQVETFSHTVGSGGSDRILLVGVSLDPRSTTSVTTITYGGTTLTKIRDDLSPDEIQTELWYLLAPATGSDNVMVTINTADRKSVIGAVSLTGVDQSTPLDVDNGANGDSSSPSVSLTTTADNAWIIDTAGYKGSSVAETPDTGQTMRWNLVSGPNINGLGSTRITTTAGSYTMGWTLGSSNKWAISAVAVNSACP